MEFKLVYKNVFTSMLFRLQASRHVGDLFEDLRDGHNLISLLEVLSGEHLVSIIFDNFGKKNE